MAGGFIEKGLPKRTIPETHFRVFITCVTAAFGGLIFGYDLGISVLTLFTSSLYLAALVASIFASKVTRAFGRRLTMISGGVLFLPMENGEGWRYSLGLAGVPAIMIIIGAMFLPDSPNSLIERGQAEKAKKELIKIRGTNDVDEEFKDLVAASEASKQVKHPWSSLFKVSTGLTSPWP
ncbi:Sugar transport protein [Arachis hypogaea]|nr:Sugar transport protein [Arachis hypogaea]